MVLIEAKNQQPEDFIIRQLYYPYKYWNDKVKKETKKNLRNLEHTLKGRGNNLGGGNLSFANNSGDNDPESLFKGWKLSV